jgi:hypothetical protein
VRCPALRQFDHSSVLRRSMTQFASLAVSAVPFGNILFVIDGWPLQVGAAKMSERRKLGRALRRQDRGVIEISVASGPDAATHTNHSGGVLPRRVMSASPLRTGDVLRIPHQQFAKFIELVDVLPSRTSLVSHGHETLRSPPLSNNDNPHGEGSGYSGSRRSIQSCQESTG